MGNMRTPIRRHGHGRIRTRRRNRCLPMQLPSLPADGAHLQHGQDSLIQEFEHFAHKNRTAPYLCNHSFLRSHPRHTTLGTGHLYRNWYAKWIFAKGNPVLTVAICINSHQSMPTSRPRLPSATHLLQKTRLRSWAGEHRLS